MRMIALALLILPLLGASAFATTGGFADNVYQWDNVGRGADWDSFSYAGYGFANTYTVADTAGANKLLTLRIYVGKDEDGLGLMKASIWNANSGGQPGTLRNWLDVDLATATVVDGWLNLDVSSWNTQDYLSAGDTFVIGYTTDMRNGVDGAMDDDGSSGHSSYSRKYSGGTYKWQPELAGDWGIRATTAPEPATLCLLGCVVGAGALVRKRRQR
jgi:hypothetical protein